jgi:hypothetical protein
MKNKYLSEQWKLYLSSLRNLQNHRNTATIILYDLLFLVLLVFVSIAFSLMNHLIGFFMYTPVSGLLVLFSLLVFVLLFVLAWCISRGLIWSRLFKKKFTAEYFKGFYLMNLLWVLIWIIPLFLPLSFYARYTKLGVETPLIEVFYLLSYLILMVFMHFTAVLYSCFFLKGGVVRSIKQSLVVGTRIHLFLFAYFSMALTILLVSFISFAFSLFGAFVSAVFVLISGLLFLVWIRLYFASFIKKHL